MIISDKDRFLELDKGGAIYTLPNETFECDEEKSPKLREWTSKEPVTPLSLEDYKLGMDAMLQNGVQVYFVTFEEFNSIKNAEDHGFSILKSLISENEKLGINYKDLPE